MQPPPAYLDPPFIRSSENSPPLLFGPPFIWHQRVSLRIENDICYLGQFSKITKPSSCIWILQVNISLLSDWKVRGKFANIKANIDKRGGDPNTLWGWVVSLFETVQNIIPLIDIELNIENRRICIPFPDPTD